MYMLIVYMINSMLHHIVFNSGALGMPSSPPPFHCNLDELLNLNFQSKTISVQKAQHHVNITMP